MYKYTAGILLFVTTILWNNASGQQEGIIIDVDFPGGNIIVVGNDNVSTLYYEVTGDTVLVRPDLRDTEGNWFYWYFRVTGAMNQTLHFHFPERHVGYFGPAISIDGGESWKWLYDDIQESYDRFIYTFGPSEVEVMFSVGIPYLQKNFDKFISSYANNRYVSLGYLTTSEKGRNVEKVYIHCTENDPKYKVLITARHHACEAMANYALEGIISSILDDGSSSMKWLRENVEFLIIPFMDKDGVEDGDQGKNRRPYDHNRDYSGESIYNSVTSLRKKVADWGGEKLKVALDLHCPYLVGGDWNENIYFPGSKEEKIAREQKKFVEEAYFGSQRMSKLVSALLNVSRIETGTYMINPENVDIVKLTRSVLDESKPLIDEKELTILLDKEDIPLIMLDPNLTTIIIQNLLTNSIKYTGSGGKITIYIKPVKKGDLIHNEVLKHDCLLIQVEDNGIGIPASQMGQIFQKLFRADNVRLSSTDGTGLGLYMVKSLIEHSQGKIWFNSIEGKGSTFYVLLPLSGMPHKSGAKKLEQIGGANNYGK